MSTEALDAAPAEPDTRAPAPVPAHPGRVAPLRGGELHEEMSSPEVEPSRTRPGVRELGRAWLAQLVRQLPRFVAEPRPSLKERLDWSYAGAWTVDRHGPKRTWMAIWTWVVWVPAAIMADLADLITGWIEYTARTPQRTLWTAIVLITSSTTLWDAPIIGVIIPRWFSVILWFQMIFGR